MPVCFCARRIFTSSVGLNQSDIKCWHTFNQKYRYVFAWLHHTHTLTHTLRVSNKHTCSPIRCWGGLFVPLPIGTIRFNQAAGLRWFTVALRIKIGCKELTLLGSTATQLQVMLCVCVCVCVCVRAHWLKHIFLYFLWRVCLSMFLMEMFFPRYVFINICI